MSKADISGEGTPFVLYGELYTTYGEIISSVVRKTRASVASQYLSKQGDVIIPTSGETPEEIATASCVMIEGVVLGGDLNIFRSEEIDGRFLAYQIRHNASRKIARIAQGVSIVHISASELKNVAVIVPERAEQHRIVELLASLDSRIDSQRRLVELLKKHKRGLSNALFSGKVRLAKNGTWKSYRLGEIVRRVTRKNGKLSDVPLTISAQYGLVDQREFFSKSVASADMSGYFLLKKNEFAYNRSSSSDYPFGSIKRLERYEQGAVSTLYICFEALGDKDDAEFLKWYFDSFAWHREVGMICAEGARNHGLLNVPTDGFFNTQHLLPTDKAERTKISSMLALAEARCQNAEGELARLTQLKTGLLQQLFV